MILRLGSPIHSHLLAFMQFCGPLAGAVAPQLTVVPAPPLHETFERMRSRWSINLFENPVGNPESPGAHNETSSSNPSA